MASSLGGGAAGPGPVWNRWSRIDIDPAKVVSQWNNAKTLADQKAKDLMEDLVMKLEAEQTPCVLIGYGLGCRVIAAPTWWSAARLRPPFSK